MGRSHTVLFLVGLAAIAVAASQEGEGNWMSFYTSQGSCEKALAGGDDGDKRPEPDLNFPPGRAVEAYKLGQEDDYQRVCTCLYDEDKASVKLDDGGNVRCEFYDGKVLSGKYAEYKIRDTYKP